MQQRKWYNQSTYSEGRDRVAEYFESVCRAVAAALDGRVESVCFQEVTSTNDLAKQYAAEARACDLSPRLFIAREQSAGRGRMGRSFLCRADKGIYMSLLYYTDEKLPDVVSVTTFAALAVSESIENVTDKKMRIKWVNDVYDEHGKVSGILVETVSLGERTGVVVGIGINVGDEDFPDELASIASSVGRLGENECARLICDTVDALITHAKRHSDRSFMDRYRSRFMLTGKHVTIISDGAVTVCGIVTGVADDGGLLILPDGETKEVCVRTGSVR